MIDLDADNAFVTAVFGTLDLALVYVSEKHAGKDVEIDEWTVDSGDRQTVFRANSEQTLERWRDDERRNEEWRRERNRLSEELRNSELERNEKQEQLEKQQKEAAKHLREKLRVAKNEAKGIR
jgi:membrane protein involved in colicin uptake